MSIWGTCAALLVLISVSGRCDDAVQSPAPVAEQGNGAAELERPLETVRHRDELRLPDFDRMIAAVHEHHQSGRMVHTREKWPRGVPLRVRLGVSRGITSAAHGHVIEFADCKNQTLLSGVMPRSLVPRGREDRGWDWTSPIPVECIGPNGESAVRVRFGNFDRSQWSGFASFPFSVELVDSMEEVLTPVVDQELTAHLAATLSVLIVGRGPGHRPEDKAYLILEFPSDLPPDLAIGLKLELLGGEEVLGTARMAPGERYRWRMKIGSKPLWGTQADVELDALIERLQGRPLQARVSPDPEYALRDFDNDRYLHWDEPFYVDVDTSALEQVE